MSRNRLGSVRECLEDLAVDCLLISNLVNIRWLTGFGGSNALVVVSSDLAWFLTDFRYQEQVAEQVEGFDIKIVSQNLYAELAEALAALGQLRVGFESRNLSVKSFEGLGEKLPDSVELTATDSLVEGLRAIKDQSEIAAIKQAAALADEAFESLLTTGVVGKKECDLAWQLEAELRQRGASAASFPPIVAGAANGALPHAEPSGEFIAEDTLVVIDWGCVLDSYCSDCTRTVATGSVSEEMNSAYSLVLKAQEAALSSIKAGESGKAVDAIARELIEAAGHGEHFGHGTGHGVGLEVHEEPRLSRTSDAVLSQGNVVTVEPGVYLPGKFGVRIEDLIVVGESGREVLTTTPKELRVVA